jgi:hypothetical protein
MLAALSPLLAAQRRVWPVCVVPDYQPGRYRSVQVPWHAQHSRIFFRAVLIILRAMLTATEMVVWTGCALLAAGIGWSKYEKKKTRDKYLAELAALEPERREKVLTRLNPKLESEIRQQLMQRFGLS